MDPQRLDYALPPDRIATTPAEPRDAARLLVARRATGELAHHRVADLPEIPESPGAGDLLVFNRTKVVPAEIEGARAATSGRVSGLVVEQPEAGRVRVMLESRGRLVPGERIDLAEGSLELIERDARGTWLAGLESELPLSELLGRIGRLPLPPYIRRERRARGEPELAAEDVERYNTVFADAAGSVAAPTAALHFTEGLLERLAARRVERAELTLHVGPGTFRPIRAERVEDHEVDPERIHVPADTIAALARTRARGGRIIPVGTTCVRALESLPDPLPDEPAGFTTATGLFIRPEGDAERPFPFRFTDAMLTNFHLPRSSLLALVAALPGVGVDRLTSWYAEARDRGYRFYSYGDAMLIL